jgi:cell division protein FtsL
MKIFGIVSVIIIFAFGIVMMRIEINRSGRAIGKLQTEVEIKEARNQYLELENTRLSGPILVGQMAQEQLKLRRTPPQNIVLLED